MLEEYAAARWGALGTAFFRLDGTTNRIAREMDMRSFNAPASKAFLYLISTRAGGMGINLATADTVVLYDTWYNPQVGGRPTRSSRSRSSSSKGSSVPRIP